MDSRKSAAESAFAAIWVTVRGRRVALSCLGQSPLIDNGVAAASSKIVLYLHSLFARPTNRKGSLFSKIKGAKIAPRHKSLALAAPPSPLASQKIAPQRRKIAPCLWLAVAPGQLAWLLAEGLGSLQDDPPTWLRRAWLQQAAEDAWPTLAMTCKLQKTRSHGRGQVNIRAHCRKRLHVRATAGPWQQQQ